MTNHWSSPLQFHSCDQNFSGNSLLLLLLRLTIFLQNPTLFAWFSPISILCLEHNKMQTFESKFNAIRFWQNKQSIIALCFFIFIWKTGVKTRASTERRSQGSWRCFFFNNLGKLRPKQAGDGSDRRFKDALRRRFLRQVPLKIKKEEEEIIQIENYDFQGHIKLKLIPSSIFTTWSENLDVNLTLGSVQYPVSQRISMVAEKGLFLEFGSIWEEAFPNLHECLFIM